MNSELSPMLELDEAVAALQTVSDCIRWGVSRFNEAELYFGHGTDNAHDEAAWLTMHALSLPLGQVADYGSCRLTPLERRHVLSLLGQRVSSRKPAAYLTGEAWFCGLPFHVNESVLVPRSPIAEMIRESFSPWADATKIESILDLCTGSGCIGIACAYAFPDAAVVISDVSPEALEVALGNVASHQLEEQVEVVESDVFNALDGRRFSLIVSNPPYVDQDDMDALPEEYRLEPVLGLAAGGDGLDIVRRILAGASDLLTDDGLLVVEVGNSADALVEAYPQLPFYWPEFENGGQGIFVLTAQQLRNAGL